MDAPHIAKTRTTSAQTYKSAEHNICKDLREHYVEIKAAFTRIRFHSKTHIYLSIYAYHLHENIKNVY